MQNISPPSKSTRSLEQFLVISGAIVCLIVSTAIWLVFSKQQPMWPLPNLYLLEMLAVSALATFDILNKGLRQFSLGGILIWAAVGIFLAFLVIGAWSIGILFAPVAGLFLIAAILSDRRYGRNLVVHLGVGIVAAFVQAAVMLAVIRFR